MKRKEFALILAAVSCLGLLGCRGRQMPDVETISTTDPTAAVTASSTASQATSGPTTAPEPTAPEISPDVVGLYIPADDGTKARKRIGQFQSKRTEKKDIDCFEVFASQEDRVTGSSFKSMWFDKWDAFGPVEDARIGFVISFDLQDGTNITKTVLKPSDAKDFYDYLEVYLYDDVHQKPGTRYTHLEDAQITDGTVITSIKLTSGSKIAQVGDILLTAFIYTGADCFDTSGEYVGDVLTTVLITQS